MFSFAHVLFLLAAIVVPLPSRLLEQMAEAKGPHVLRVSAEIPAVPADRLSRIPVYDSGTKKRSKVR